MKKRIMRKEGLENLILTGQFEGKRDRGKQCITYLVSLMAEQGLGKIKKTQNLLSARKSRSRGEQYLLKFSRDTVHRRRK